MTNETPAQFTERMRIKYKDALELLEKEGPNELQAAFGKALDDRLGLKPDTAPKLEKLSDILKRY